MALALPLQEFRLSRSGIVRVPVAFVVCRKESNLASTSGRRVDYIRLVFLCQAPSPKNLPEGRSLEVGRTLKDPLAIFPLDRQDIAEPWLQGKPGAAMNLHW